jgi:predicted TPR repeat methyltransferase
MTPGDGNDTNGDLAAAYRRLAAACHRNGKLAHAAAAWRQAAAFDPDDLRTQRGLAASLVRTGEAAEAERILRAAIARHGSSPALRFELAALTGAEVPPETPRAYVTAAFDAYAAHYDRHLAERLKYRVPQLLYDAVATVMPEGPLDILDLGCGTGLTGVAFKPLAHSLAGVDLSVRMIELAQQRGIYDRLVVDDLVAMMAAERERFDLVLAADVLVYVGDLAGVFAGVARVLRPTGLFAFSVEAHDGDGFVLRRSRRYAHGLSYVERQAAAAGLAVVRATTEVLRLERQADVPGHVVLLKTQTAR